MHDLLEWHGLVLLPERQVDAPVPKFKSLNGLKGYMDGVLSKPGLVPG